MGLHIIQDLQTMVSELLQCFAEKNKKTSPKRIVFFVRFDISPSGRRPD